MPDRIASLAIFISRSHLRPRQRTVHRLNIILPGRQPYAPHHVHQRTSLLSGHPLLKKEIRAPRQRKNVTGRDFVKQLPPARCVPILRLEKERERLAQLRCSADKCLRQRERRVRDDPISRVNAGLQEVRPIQNVRCIDGLKVVPVKFSLPVWIMTV